MRSINFDVKKVVNGMNSKVYGWENELVYNKYEWHKGNEQKITIGNECEQSFFNENLHFIMT